MKQYSFLTDKKRGIIIAVIRVKFLGIQIFKQKFSTVNLKPKKGKRCWLAEKKHSAYLLNKKLSDELTEEYLKK